MFNYNLMKFMKRIGLFLIFSLVYLLSVTAQETSNGYFVGIGAKGNLYLNNHTILKGTSLGGELFGGKWFSPVLGARLFLEGGQLHPTYLVGKTEGMVHQTYGLGRVDLMLNLTNLFRTFSEDQFYNLIPHVGVGYGHVFSRTILGNNTFKQENRASNADAGSIVFGGGLLNTFKLTKSLALFVDLNLDVVNQKFDYYYNPKGSGLKKFNGIASGAIGLVMNFGGSKPKEVIAPPPVQPAPAPAPAPAPKPEPKPEPVKPTPQPAPAPVKEVKKVEPLTTNVFFTIGKSVIAAAQQANIAKIADFLNANPNTKVTVTGYADKGTGSRQLNLNLSEQRARAVAKALVDKYKINKNRIVTDWKGDTVQPFAENVKNRVAILISE